MRWPWNLTTGGSFAWIRRRARSVLAASAYQPCGERCLCSSARQIRMIPPTNKNWKSHHALPFVRTRVEPRFLFTVVSLTNTHVSTPVHYGDTIWLRLSQGVGGPTWRDGSVLGTQPEASGCLCACHSMCHFASRRGAQEGTQNQRQSAIAGNQASSVQFRWAIQEEAQGDLRACQGGGRGKVWVRFCYPRLLA